MVVKLLMPIRVGGGSLVKVWGRWMRRSYSYNGGRLPSSLFTVLVSDRMCNDSILWWNCCSTSITVAASIPSQWHASAVPRAPLLLTVPAWCLSELACAPSAGGPNYCLFGLHTPWSSPCRESCGSLLLSAVQGHGTST